MWREIMEIREQEVRRITRFRNMEKILKVTSQFQVVKNCKIYKKFEISKILKRPPKMSKLTHLAATKIPQFLKALSCYCQEHCTIL